MPGSRLTAIITALMFLAGSHGAHAAFNLAQLQIIEQLILSRDCGALLAYLNENPGIMQGSDPLARELRSFADGVEGGIIECLPVPDGPFGTLPTDPTPIY